MSKTITATEFKKNLGHYLDLSQTKEEVYITKNGSKIARLSPIYTDVEEYFIVKEEAEFYGNLTVSYDEFMEMAEHSEHRLEYLNGEVYQMASPSVSHQKAVGNIHFHFRLALQKYKCDVFVSPFDVHFWKQNVKNPDVLQPDVFIACDTEENINEKDRYMGIPILVVEVLSPNTRSRDLIFKLNSYMLSGVKEYWVVDPVDRQVIVYLFEEFTIKHLDSYKSGQIKSYTFDMEVDLNDVFDA